MATDMTPEELEAALKSGASIDSFDYRSEESEDDYIVAQLYRMPDGRLFRYVESSGMDSTFSGAGEFGQWLAASEQAGWSRF
ncbi:hypothetical protein [Phenylobacterium sp.]|uniref:hypothetical protein n=1 Tax=Phenylobacterium sp. TaxID=1871053 RepID=UPI002737455E|nr:hypothetical protein [Phenylobacterium sp.]MDP3633602.1 hypothetical protein [Phenylobacterium sp.]MDZ4053423.1 hypothetical protein [Phenylobacterium sp.]